MVSVTILAKNCESTLAKTLESLKGFDEVIVIDNGSTDRTEEIAKGFPNVRIVHETFIGFGPLHNVALSHCHSDWVLSIDSDEVLSEELQSEIQALHLDETKVYALQRRSFYRGHFVRGCGWYPDVVPRLFNRRHFRFSDDHVHEKVLCSPDQVILLNGFLNHTPYQNVGQFLAKMQLYSALFAEQTNKSSSPCKAIGHGVFAFLKSYLLRRGFLDGYAGFLISAYNGHTAFYKYLKLYERNQDAGKRY